MNAWRGVRLVAGREIRERARSKAMRVITLLMVTFVVALIVIPAMVGSSAKTAHIGLVGDEAQSLATNLALIGQTSKVDVSTTNVASDDDARALLDDGTIDVALSVTGDGATIEVERGVDGSVEAVIQATLNEAHIRQTLADAGISWTDVAPALTPVPVAVTELNPSPKEADPMRATAALAAGMILYIVLLAYGGNIATGVSQEKSSRAAEVLLSTLRPSHLLVGKVAGIGTVAFAQMAITVGAGLAANTVVHGTDVTRLVWEVLPSVLGWFILGFALYSLAFAAAGALVTRQEDIQFAIMPLIMPLVGAFFLVYLLIYDPENLAGRICSYVPLFSPVLMPARIALGPVAWWEIVLAVALVLASIWGVARMAGRVYARSYLSSGARVSWRAALRSKR